MVAVSPPAKVLITGANGYLATWIVKKYLEAEYSVRGTVRSLSRSAFLKDKFAYYGDRLELVVVEDITKDDAFDEAVKGVDVIVHTASPFHYKVTEPDGTIPFLPEPVFGRTGCFQSSSPLLCGEPHRSWALL